MDIDLLISFLIIYSFSFNILPLYFYKMFIMKYLLKYLYKYFSYIYKNINVYIVEYYMSLLR
jgi:hypothetical protein